MAVGVEEDEGDMEIVLENEILPVTDGVAVTVAVIVTVALRVEVAEAVGVVDELAPSTTLPKFRRIQRISKLFKYGGQWR